MADILSFPDPHRRRIGYRIVVAPNLWGNAFEVSIEPATCTHPFRSFKTFALAMEHAEAVRRVEGWPISTPENGGHAA